MKKLTAILLTLLLISTSAFPAFASDGAGAGYDDPAEAMPPLFGSEAIFPSDFELFTMLMQSLQDMTLSEFSEKIISIEPSILLPFYFMLTFPLWVVAQF